MRVFVTVGNAPARFERLLGLVDEALGDARFADVTGTCQHGTGCTRPTRLESVRVLSRAEFAREIDAADVVVTHAGVGSLSEAIRAGHRPIVVPRRHGYREHVNDHQLEIARELERRELVTVAEDAEALARALATTRRRASAPAVGAELAMIEAALEKRGRRAVPGSTLFLRLLALAAPGLDHLRFR